jgi:alkylation response protein AidB-like acyl-CoA dehydrogenase
MNLELNEEHDALRDTVRRFVAKNCPPMLAKEWDETSHYPEDLIEAMADLGWTSLPFPEEDGGAGAGPVELSIVAEELGRASFDIAGCYIGNLITSLAMHGFADDQQRAKLLPELFAGRQRMAASISEPGAGSDVKSISTRAEDKGGHFLVSGQKLWCTGAGLPRALIAMYVRTSGAPGDRDGLTVLLVDPATEGVELRKIPTLARHVMGTYEVYLTNAEIPKSAVIGIVGKGWDVLMHGLELERVLLSGAYVGAAQQTLDEALQYSKERSQFGSRIGDFQVLAHTMADLQTEVDAARLLAYRAAALLAAKKPCSREGSMAKLYGSETYVKVARAGMQIFGGYGFSTETIMSFRFRESIVTTISGGTSQVLRNGIARSMGLRP